MEAGRRAQVKITLLLWELVVGAATGRLVEPVTEQDRMVVVVPLAKLLILTDILLLPAAVAQDTGELVN
jgi:uncharacterized membrane protein YoaK (UPF0700 family)